MSDPTSAPPHAPFPPAPPRMQFPQRSVGLKLLIVCALALLMAIPTLFVVETVRERRTGSQQATIAVSQAVGGHQTVLGPVIAVPYSRAPDPKFPDNRIYGLAYAYAETGTVDSTATVTERTRSIHSIPVFDTQASFSATFDPGALRDAIPADASPIWSSAHLYMGITDTRGMKDAYNVMVNGEKASMEPISTHNASNANDPTIFRDTPPPAGLNLAGVMLPDLETQTELFDVTASTHFSGSEYLSFLPFAKDTTVTLNSNWNDPSFIGTILPTEHTATQNSTEGFTATWRIPYVARGIAGSGADLNLHELQAGAAPKSQVRFMIDVNAYQSVERALKYALMFVGLVFLSYFLFEISSKARAHPAQYLLVGLTQTIFYVLLLALSERIGFDWAFLIAAFMTVALTSAYAMSVFRSRAYGLRALGILSGIYGLSYVLMRAEDNALLAGAFISFSAIALTMYLTRNIDWYGNRPNESPA